MVQEQTTGVAIPLELYVKMAAEIPAVRYVKQERQPVAYECDDYDRRELAAILARMEQQAT